MLPVIIIGLAVVLAVTASFIQKNNTSTRASLLRWSVRSLVVVMICTQLLPLLGHPPLVDVLRRLASLAMQACLILLALTFRRRGSTRKATIGVWSAMFAIASIEVVLAVIIYLVGAGISHTHTWTDNALLAYHSLHGGAFILTATVIIIGCLRVMFAPAQPMTVRAAMLLTTAAGLAGSAYIVLEFLGLTAPHIVTHSTLQQATVLMAVALVAAAVVLGVIHSTMASIQHTSVLRIAVTLVQPLWNTVTTLHPEVILHHRDLSPQDHLLRLVIETHDGLTLIRRDPDPALTPVHLAHPRDPRLSAALLLHLLGETVMTARPSPVSAWVIRHTGRSENASLITSIQQLYEISHACATREKWWQPIKPT